MNKITMTKKGLRLRTVMTTEEVSKKEKEIIEMNGGKPIPQHLRKRLLGIS